MEYHSPSYDFVIIGSGLASWVLCQRLAQVGSVLVVEGGGLSQSGSDPEVHKVQLSSSGVPPSDISFSSIRVDSFGGCSKFWNGHLYLASPSESELQLWPDRLRSGLREYEGIARRLLGARAERPSGKWRQDVVSGFPPDIGDVASWPHEVSFKLNSYVQNLIIEKGRVIGLALKNTHTGAVENLHGNGTYIVAGGGIHSGRLVSESKSERRKPQSLTFHLVQSVGEVKVPRELLSESGPGLHNPVVLQERTETDFGSVHTNFVLSPVSAVRQLSAGYWGRIFRGLMQKVKSRVQISTPAQCLVMAIHELPARTNTILDTSDTTTRVGFSLSKEDRAALADNVKSLRNTLKGRGCLLSNLHLRSTVSDSWVSGGHYLSAMPAGQDSSSAIDDHLLVKGTHNCYAVSAAVFPTPLAANPSQTLAALALMLGSTLAGQKRPVPEVKL